MTISQVINAYNGYFERESERSKAQKIVGWETTRWQTMILYNIQADKKHKITDPRKMITFEWEEKDEVTKEQFETLANRFPDTIKNGHQ